MKKILNFKDIDGVAVKLAHLLRKNDTIALIGDLGTGKTTFVKKLAKELGVKENVKSPTFTYVSEYFSGKTPVYHFDVYRISDPEEVYEIGFEDYINNDGIVIVEWADLILEELPRAYIKIIIEHNDEESRKLEITCPNNKEREKEILNYVGFRD